MARSGSSDFSVSATEIINAAMRIIGVAVPGETLSGEDSSAGQQALNMMLKTWMGLGNKFAPGLKVWQRTATTLTPSSQKISYEIKTSGGDLTLSDGVPVAVLQVSAKNTDGVETVLDPMLLEEYFAVSNKTEEGIPTRFYYERQYDKGVLYFDIKLSSTAAGYTYPMIYLRPVQDIDSLSDDLDFPQHWYEALKFHLAIRLAPEYGRPLTDEIKELANLSLAQAQTFYPEDATADQFFQPEKVF